MIKPVHLVTAVVHHSDHAEHIGLVAYAACELLKAETALHYCIIWLVVTGAWTVLTRDIRPSR